MLIQHFQQNIYKTVKKCKGTNIFNEHGFLQPNYDPLDLTEYLLQNTFIDKNMNDLMGLSTYEIKPIKSSGLKEKAYKSIKMGVCQSKMPTRSNFLMLFKW